MGKEIYGDVLINLIRPHPDTADGDKVYDESNELVDQIRKAVSEIPLPPGWELEVED